MTAVFRRFAVRPLLAAMFCLLAPLLVVDSSAVASPDRLTVRGRDIVNSRGEIVSMRGINFGGWLMMEIWIPSLELEWHDRLPQMARELGFEAEWRAADKEAGGFDDDKECIHDYLARLHQKLQAKIPADKFNAYLDRFHREPPVYAAKDMDDLLQQRFGEAGAQEFWDTFHNTWITETDFQLARALEFNFVRIPFWYRWFEDNAAPFRYQEYGFRYLDRAVAWAREHGLCVMLDLHGAPGCQSPWDHTGELSNARFFTSPEFQRRAAALWQALATRYRDNPTVFAYDLLNEPFSARDVREWTAAHDLMYRAIRTVDAQTIIVMEDGYKLEEPEFRQRGFFPKPGSLGWTNVVYSIHFYSGWDPELTVGEPHFDHGKVLRELERVARREQRRCRLPIYLGEFSTMNDLPNDLAAMKHFMTRFNELGWHYSPWTWKYVNDTGRGSIWGVYQYNQPLDPPAQPASRFARDRPGGDRAVDDGQLCTARGLRKNPAGSARSTRADSEMTEDDVIVRYENDEVVGLTVLHAGKR